jgi:cytochrome b6-f complex iron-sulfur subunit
MNEENKPPADPAETAKKPCGGGKPCVGTCGSKNAGEPTDRSSDDADSSDDSESTTRSQFIRAAFTGVTVCWAGITLLPVVAYLTPPPGENDDKTKVTSIEVCKLAELPKGTGRNFRFGSSPALIIHTEDGQLHAFKAICTHLGCTVQFRDDKQIIFCACHGGEYDAHSGKNISGPPPKPLTALKAEVSDGKIIVSRA